MTVQFNFIAHIRLEVKISSAVQALLSFTQ